MNRCTHVTWRRAAAVNEYRQQNHDHSGIRAAQGNRSPLQKKEDIHSPFDKHISKLLDGDKEYDRVKKYRWYKEL